MRQIHGRVLRLDSRSDLLYITLVSEQCCPLTNGCIHSCTSPCRNFLLHGHCLHLTALWHPLPPRRFQRHQRSSQALHVHLRDDDRAQSGSEYRADDADRLLQGDPAGAGGVLRFAPSSWVARQAACLSLSLQTALPAASVVKLTFCLVAQDSQRWKVRYHLLVLMHIFNCISNGHLCRCRSRWRTQTTSSPRTSWCRRAFHLCGRLREAMASSRRVSSSIRVPYINLRAESCCWLASSPCP